jgi:hypothetical protein
VSDIGRRCFWDGPVRIEAGLLLTHTKVTGAPGWAPVLVVVARSNPDLNWGFLVQ